MIGVFLIIGTIIYLTGNMPSTAQRSGDHSRVQLMNIGRDSLDLIVQTPIYEPSPDVLKGVLNRTYYLEADKEFVMIGEEVNFTVYYLNNTLVNKNLTLRQTILGFNNFNIMKNITGGKTNYTWTNSPINHSEFSIQVVDPSGFSNSVTIKVGDFHLDTDTYGICICSNDTNVTGVVYNSSGGISNLTIQILDENYVMKNLSATNTTSGKLIENFDNHNNWSTNGNKANDTTNKTEGYASMSVNSTYRDFWIKKDNLTQPFDRFDILSFDFYSNTGNEFVTVELINGTSRVPGKTTMNRTKLYPNNWTKFNTMIKIPDPVVINSIKITVSNISIENYLIDKMRIGEGKFSFNWSDSSIPYTGIYYINATDDNDSSNMHLISYTDYEDEFGGRTLWQNSVIYETKSVNLSITDKTGVVPFETGFTFNVNSVPYTISNCPSFPSNYSLCFLSDEWMTIRFTANTSGDYYLYGYKGGEGGALYDNYTNSILIHVLPLVNEGPIGNTCVNKSELNEYMNRYLPDYVNYNLYLIGPEGKRFECPKFENGELINGYPTDEAVTVSRLMHINYQDINKIIELRMVLWYK